ncbi:hypothetical protein ABZ646_34885 [Streptomyces sp. NPDC007162]
MSQEAHLAVGVGFIEQDPDHADEPVELRLAIGGFNRASAVMAGAG